MSAPSSRRLLPTQPPELVLHDELSTCPYLPGEVARLPLRLPVRPLSREELSARLRDGDRRQGLLLYRPTCPSCNECEPIRIDVSAFRPRNTQRRVLRRGDALLETRMGSPRLTEDRVRLYNAHKHGRGLQTVSEPPIDSDAYRAFLVDSCCEAFEMAYYFEGQLIGAATVDRGSDALSAVYCFFDPAFSHLSPGTYSILKQIELCRRLGLRYLYLGLFISGCETMRYKAEFFPHERSIGGHWHRVEPPARRGGE